VKEFLPDFSWGLCRRTRKEIQRSRGQNSFTGGEGRILGEKSGALKLSAARSSKRGLKADREKVIGEKAVGEVTRRCKHELKKKPTCAENRSGGRGEPNRSPLIPNAK